MIWYVHLAWVVMAGLLGFLVAAVFSRRLRMPRSWYLLPYVIVTGAFAWLYFQWSQIPLWELFRNNWGWGVVGAIVRNEQHGKRKTFHAFDPDA